MNKKYQISMLVLLLIVISFSIGYFIRDVRKNAMNLVPVINKSQSMEIYEEFSLSNILEIRIDTVNVNLKVLPSQDQNIRVLYRPSVNLTEHAYYIENKIMYIQLEKVEASGSMVASEEEMIYLYLPKQTDVTLKFQTETGYVDIDGVGLRNLNIHSQNGIVSISNSHVDLDAIVETIAGKVVVKDLRFDKMSIKTNTALISCFMTQPAGTYEGSLKTKEGSVYVNAEKVSNNYKLEKRGVSITDDIGITCRRYSSTNDGWNKQ